MRLILIPSLLIFLFACSNPSPEPLASFNQDSLVFYAKTQLKNENGWILLSEPGICWRCSGYYYFLGKEVKAQDSLELVLITHKMRKATREDMYDGINWDFSERIVHREDPEAFAALGRNGKSGNRLIHLYGDSVEVFPLDDRDAMDTLWPEIKKIIQEGN